jgi:putative ABC transport system permease protein
VSHLVENTDRSLQTKGERREKTSSSTTAMSVSAMAQLSQQERETSLQGMLRAFQIRKRGPIGMTSASFSSAIEALWGNRTRSFLTMLGIFIGVAAVVASMTLTQSASAYFTQLIEGLGSNTIIIQPGATNRRGIVMRGSAQTLTLRDVQSLERLPHVGAITPIVFTRAQVIYEDQNWRTNVYGVNPSFQGIQKWEIADGLWFSESETAGAQPVVVLGDTVAKNLFGNSGIKPVGQKIRIGKEVFRVVGVTAPKGGFNQDDTVFVPFSTALARFGFRSTQAIGGIQLQVDDAENVDSTAQAAASTLRQNHRILAGRPDDFQMITSDQLLEQGQLATQMISLLLVGIAAISLTVGGIGIMNIMLVSVTQRTHEIGIRMSVGARRADIRNQFLMEALLLCLLGGGLGLLGGLLAGWGMTTGFGMPTVITTVMLVTPFVVSVSIAILFGLYPASRAARLDPVVALRRTR